MNLFPLNIDKRRFAIAIAIAMLVATNVFAHGNRAFVNGHWFNGSKFVQKTMWSVDGVFRETFDGKADETIDLRGGFAIPPFAEGHTHDFTMPDAPAVERYLALGIFYAKNSNSIARLVDSVRPLVNKPESVDVIWANGGLTATGGHPTQIYSQIAPRLGWKPEEMNGEAYWIIDSAADLEKKWDAIAAKKPDFIKVYLDRSEQAKANRGLDPALVPAIVARAHASKLRVVAHVTTAADYRAAIAAGVDEIAHLPLEKLTADDARAAAAKKIWTVTTTLSHRPLDGIADVDAIHRHNLTLLRDAGAPVAVGTDGSKSVVDEIENVRRLGVFGDAALLRIAVQETPRTIFPARKIGRLESGFEASFIVLAKNPLADFRAIRDITLRVKGGHPLPPPRRPLVERLTALALKSGASSAIDEYRRLQKEEGEVWNFSEQQVNATGYTLLQQRRLDDAIAIFRFNVELFPKSSNVYDSLGEALRTKGDVEDAIANYAKSLELNPHNDNARRALEEMRKK
jgi:tetratricopeptide (TPR) repeat protein